MNAYSQTNHQPSLGNTLVNHSSNQKFISDRSYNKTRGLDIYKQFENLNPLELQLAINSNPEILNYDERNNTSLLLKLVQNIDEESIEKIDIILNNQFYNPQQINVQNKQGESPLYIATEKRIFSLVKLFLEKGANPNIQQQEGETSLHLAAFNNDVEIIEILGLYNASPFILTFYSKYSPYDYAKQKNNIESVNVIEKIMLKIDDKTTKPSITTINSSSTNFGKRNTLNTINTNHSQLKQMSFNHTRNYSRDESHTLEDRHQHYETSNINKNYYQDNINNSQIIRSINNQDLNKNIQLDSEVNHMRESTNFLNQFDGVGDRIEKIKNNLIVDSYNTESQDFSINSRQVPYQGNIPLQMSNMIFTNQSNNNSQYLSDIIEGQNSSSISNNYLNKRGDGGLPGFYSKQQSIKNQDIYQQSQTQSFHMNAPSFRGDQIIYKTNDFVYSPDSNNIGAFKPNIKNQNRHMILNTDLNQNNNYKRIPKDSSKELINNSYNVKNLYDIKNGINQQNIKQVEVNNSMFIQKVNTTNNKTNNVKETQSVKQINTDFVPINYINNEENRMITLKADDEELPSHHSNIQYGIKAYKAPTKEYTRNNALGGITQSTAKRETAEYLDDEEPTVNHLNFYPTFAKEKINKESFIISTKPLAYFMSETNDIDINEEEYNSVQNREEKSENNFYYEEEIMENQFRHQRQNEQEENEESIVNQGIGTTEFFSKKPNESSINRNEESFMKSKAFNNNDSVYKYNNSYYKDHYASNFMGSENSSKMNPAINNSVAYMQNSKKVNIKLTQKTPDMLITNKEKSLQMQSDYSTKPHNEYKKPELPPVNEESNRQEVKFNTTSNKQIFNFLREIGCDSFAGNLVLNGYDDLNMLIEQTKSGIDLTDQELKTIGISSPGSRAKIIIRLEELSKIYDFEVPTSVYHKLNANDTVSLNVLKMDPLIKNLDSWLSQIKLDNFTLNFVKAGYNSLELIYLQMNSK